MKAIKFAQNNLIQSLVLKAKQNWERISSDAQISGLPTSVFLEIIGSAEVGSLECSKIISGLKNYIHLRGNLSEQEILQLYSVVPFSKADVQTLQTIPANITVPIASFIKLKENFETEKTQLQQEITTLKVQKGLKDLCFYTGWTAEMISFWNTSHTPSAEKKLAFINDNTELVIAWVSKPQGWLQFSLPSPIKFVATGFVQGASTWDIQCSDDNTNWTTVATYSEPSTIAVWGDKGAHRYWRYMMTYNTGSRYYYGYKWYTSE